MKTMRAIALALAALFSCSALAQWPGYSTAGRGSAILSAISAATGANTLANGNNTGQVWNWANTTDSTSSFTFGETSAATNGTSTAGVPNQVLLKLTTAASSTQSPLSVYSRATHVFSVSPSAAQVLHASGSATVPSVSDTNTNTGLFWPLTNTLGVGNATDGEWVRFASRILQASRGSADASAYAINVRKSRGTVASPTVITTADVLSTISGYGYVGATNTYLEATRIAAVSTGTITDATTGLGGYIGFFTALQGTSSTPAEMLRLDSNGHLNFLAGAQSAAPTVTAGCGGSPTVTGNDSAFVLNVGSGGAATTCTVTFNKGFTNAPHCFAQDQTSQAITTTAVPGTSTVVLTSTAAWTAASKIDVLCVGHL